MNKSHSVISRAVALQASTRFVRPVALSLTLLSTLAFTAGAMAAKQYPIYDETPHADTVERRLDRQRHRIEKGFHRGDLTRREARKLAREHRDLRHLRDHLGIDGRLDKRDLRRLTNRLDDASDKIFRKRHNLRERRFRPYHEYYGGGHLSGGYYGTDYRYKRRHLDRRYKYDGRYKKRHGSRHGFRHGYRHRDKVPRLGHRLHGKSHHLRPRHVRKRYW